MSAPRERYSKVGPYILMQTIGVGSFGKVKLAIHEQTHQRYACKVLDKSLVRERTLSVNKEISIMRCLRHHNTVSLVGVLTTSTKVFIIMELVTGGELFSEIERHKRLTENYARFYFRQLVEGVEHCHEHGIFHRDLKPENLLLDENRTLKISDFGLSAFKVSQHEGGHDSVTGSLTLHTQCGTPNYVAPEIITLDSEGYSGARADVWSCGVILYVLVAGALPFDAVEMDALFRLIVRGDPEFPEYFSYELKDLITRMLQRNPEKRLTLSEVRRHPWFNGTVESCMPGGTPPVPAPGHPPIPSNANSNATLPPSATEPASQRQHQQRASALDTHARSYESPDHSGSPDPASPSFKSSAPSSCSSSSSSGSSSQSPPNSGDATLPQSSAKFGVVSPLAEPRYQLGHDASMPGSVPIDQSLFPKDSLDVTIQAQVVGSEIVLGARPPSDGDDEGSENANDCYDEDARNASDHHQNGSSDAFRYVGSTYNGDSSVGGDNAVSQRISLLEPFVAPELQENVDNGRSDASFYVDAKSRANGTAKRANASDESDSPNEEKMPILMRVKEETYASDSSVQSSDDDFKYEEAKEIQYAHDFDPTNPNPDNATQPDSTVRGVRRVRSVEDMDDAKSQDMCQPYAQQNDQSASKAPVQPSMGGPVAMDSVKLRREHGRVNSYTGASTPPLKKKPGRKSDRQRRLREEQAKRAAQHNLSQRYAATNNSWVKSSGDQMVWCHLMKDFDLIPDQVEFGIPSDTLSDLWQKGLAREGLGPKKSFMEVRYGAIQPAPTRSTMYLSPQRRAGAQGAEGYMRRRQRYHARTRPEDLRKPFPPAVQEKLERLTTSPPLMEVSERTRSPNYMDTDMPARAHGVARTMNDERALRVGRANIDLANRAASDKKNTRGDRVNVVTFATDTQLIDQTSPMLSGESGAQSVMTTPPHVDRPALSEMTSAQDSPRTEPRGDPSLMTAPEVELPARTARSPRAAVTGDDDSCDVHSGKDPPVDAAERIANGPRAAETNNSRTVSPTNRSFVTTASGGSRNGGGSNTGDWSSGRSKSTSRGDRNSPPPRPYAPEQARGSGTGDSATWAGSGSLSAGSGSGTNGAVMETMATSRSSRSQAHAGTNVLSVPSAPRSEASEMMLWSDEQMAGSEDMTGRLNARKSTGLNHVYNGDEERIGSSSGRSGPARLGRTTGGMRGVASISKVSPFELNIPSPKGSNPPSNHVLNRVPSVTARLFGRRETTVGQMPKSRWQFQTARGVDETYKVLNDVLGIVGVYVNRTRRGRRIRLQCEWRRDGAVGSDGDGGGSGLTDRERSSTAAGMLIVIEAADQGGLSAVQVSRSGSGRRADDAEMQVVFERLHEAFCEQLNKMTPATRDSSPSGSDDMVVGDAGASEQGGDAVGATRRAATGRFDLGRGALRRFARVVHARA